MASNVSELSVSSMLLLSANGCSSNGFASAFLPLAPYKPHISTTYHYIKSKNIKPTAITTKCIFDRQTVQTHLIHWSVWYCLIWLQLVLLWIHFENKQNVIFVNVDVHLLKEDFLDFFSQLLWSSPFTDIWTSFETVVNIRGSKGVEEKGENWSHWVNLWILTQES